MRMLSLILVLFLAQTAWAEDIYPPKGFRLEWISSEEQQKELDHFLSTVIQPEIEAGNGYLDTNHNIRDNRLGAIAHYLKALVLLEQEKMRRGK